jgi:DNA-binding transcriptional ArsR family regulator
MIEAKMLKHTTLKSGTAAEPMAALASAAQWQPRAAEAAALLKALGHPDRLLLLCQLVLAERTVSELGEAAGVGQPSLSQQLAVLRGERLVATRREGKSIFYRIDSPAALAVLQTLYLLYCSEAPAAPSLSQPQVTPSNRRRAAQPAKETT